MTPRKKIPTILIDVDKTLLIGREGRYNYELINALKICGFTSIYLFTSMSLREIVEEIADSNYSSRPKLIAKLKEEGIEVLAVATPADASYKRGIGAAYKELFEKQHARVGKKELTISNYPNDESFTKDRDTYKQHHDAVANSAKMADDKKSDSRQVPETEKSKLYQYFLEQQNPESCVVIDDVMEHINAIKQVSKIPVAGVHVESKTTTADFVASLMSLSLPGILCSNKFNSEHVHYHTKVIYDRASSLEKQGNNSAASIYFEIAYILLSIINKNFLDIKLLKVLNDAKKKANNFTQQHATEVEKAEMLRSAIMKADPFLMQYKKMEIRIGLFKLDNNSISKSLMSFISSAKSTENFDNFNREVLNPLASLISQFPNQFIICVDLLNTSKDILTEEQYNFCIKKLQECVNSKSETEHTKSPGKK